MKIRHQIFEPSRGINGTNVLTKFHEDQTINVASRVFTRQNVDDGRRTTDKRRSQKLAMSTLCSDKANNVTSSVKMTPTGSHVFLRILTIFKLNHRIQETNVLTKFHEYWAKNLSSRLFTCFHFIHIEKTAPTPGGHVFLPIWTILELFHDYWAKIVTSRVNTALPPGGHVFQRTNTILNSAHIHIAHQIFELGRGIIGTNILTKFHEDRTRNVASRVFTRQNVDYARRTKEVISKAHHEHVMLR
ncbi:hypothetical protein DPMN_031002 [Dreissena polymorpha]|uniref:Uncharacterized protein n=1 Tax=Dreissena polymorpha TaxID=45954 RepID=A0A9D4M119_DREPO|nr:hypothetical protein DPMN_031002 [Dreissena polymorpha]